MSRKWARPALFGLVLLGLTAGGPAMAERSQGKGAIPAPPSDAAFSTWLAGVHEDARRKGLPEAEVKRALAGAKYLPRVIELDRHQPEFTLTFWRYMKNAISDKRIAQGRRLLKQHAPLLKRVADRYGVQPRFLVAIWGLESNFGQFTGTFPLVSALSTLAFDARRGVFFRSELLAALEIIANGDVPADAKGSWAGALGNTQFIPTTYLAHAIDFDGDEKRDLWGSLPDVFASSANYLARSGWDAERTWGREVKLPKTFEYGLTGLNVRKKLADWQKLGVRRADGSALPRVDIEASLILPAGAAGPAFLVYQNFRTVLVWNRSILYALAVGHLSDRIAGGAPLTAKAPVNDVPLTRIDIQRIQSNLARLGLDPGGADGVAGPRTRLAIQAYQKRKRLPADGFPTAGLLERLESDR